MNLQLLERNNIEMTGFVLLVIHQKLQELFFLL